MTTTKQLARSSSSTCTNSVLQRQLFLNELTNKLLNSSCQQTTMLQNTSVTSILLVPVRVMDELPMQLLGLLRVKLLSAVRALKRPLHPDTHVGHASIAPH